MDALLRLTLTLSRLTRRRWTRAEALVALGVIGIALAIGLIDKLGYWPEALRAEHVRRGPYRP